MENFHYSIQYVQYVQKWAYIGIYYENMFSTWHLHNCLMRNSGDFCLLVWWGFFLGGGGWGVFIGVFLFVFNCNLFCHQFRSLWRILSLYIIILNSIVNYYIKDQAVDEGKKNLKQPNKKPKQLRYVGGKRKSTFINLKQVILSQAQNYAAFPFFESTRIDRR